MALRDPTALPGGGGIACKWSGSLGLTRLLYRQQTEAVKEGHRAQQATLEIRVGYLTLLTSSCIAGPGH